MSTIRDVAIYAQVSPATVSQVLNGRGQFSHATRQRVHDAMQMLNYRARSRGRPSSDTQSRQIVLLLPRYSSRHNGSLSVFWEKVISGIRTKLSETGDYLTLFFDVGYKSNGSAFQQLADEGRVTGVILGNTDDEASYTSWLRDRKIAFVAMDDVPEHSEFSFVQVNGVEGGKLAADHLTNLGHQRMGFVRPGGTQHRSYVQQRRLGFEQGLKERGAKLVVEKSFPSVPQAAASPAVKQFARQLRAKHITGVFCPNDGLALACVDAFESIGSTVPDDVSVVGFDGIGMRSANGLQLTSVSYDKQGLGRAAASLLLQVMAEGDDVDAMSKTLKAHLVACETTAPVRPRR